MDLDDAVNSLEAVEEDDDDRDTISLPASRPLPPYAPSGPFIERESEDSVGGGMLLPSALDPIIVCPLTSRGGALPDPIIVCPLTSRTAGIP